MKTIITSVKGPPLRRVLCSFLFGAVAFCVVPSNIQAAIQAPADIVWVTTGNTIAKYNADGTAINTNFITLQPKPFITHPYIGGILVSGPNLYFAAEWTPDLTLLYAILHHLTWYWDYDIDACDAVTGNGNSIFARRFVLFGNPWMLPFRSTGMALSGTNLYVANQNLNSISKINTTGGGNLFFIKSTVTIAPYALAVGGPNGNILYVTNNYQNSNGDNYISTYTADTGALIKPYFIQIKTTNTLHSVAGLNGLALKKATTDTPYDTLYVSVFSGTAPGVYTYKADMGQLLKGPFVTVNGPMGIAIGSSPLNRQHPTLYVASQQDSAIYEFDATTGAQLSYSIKLSGAPTNITVEPSGPQTEAKKETPKPAPAE